MLKKKGLSSFDQVISETSKFCLGLLPFLDSFPILYFCTVRSK